MHPHLIAAVTAHVVAHHTQSIPLGVPGEIAFAAVVIMLTAMFLGFLFKGIFGRRS